MLGIGEEDNSVGLTILFHSCAEYNWFQTIYQGYKFISHELHVFFSGQLDLIRSSGQYLTILDTCFAIQAQSFDIPLSVVNEKAGSFSQHSPHDVGQFVLTRGLAHHFLRRTFVLPIHTHDFSAFPFLILNDSLLTQVNFSWQFAHVLGQFDFTFFLGQYLFDLESFLAVHAQSLMNPERRVYL